MQGASDTTKSSGFLIPEYDTLVTSVNERILLWVTTEVVD
jgi:hypothetical protein